MTEVPSASKMGAFEGMSRTMPDTMFAACSIPAAAVSSDTCTVAPAKMGTTVSATTVSATTVSAATVSAATVSAANVSAATVSAATVSAATVPPPPCPPPPPRASASRVRRGTMRSSVATMQATATNTGIATLRDCVRTAAANSPAYLRKRKASNTELFLLGFAYAMATSSSCYLRHGTDALSGCSISPSPLSRANCASQHLAHLRGGVRIKKDGQRGRRSRVAQNKASAATLHAREQHRKAPTGTTRRQRII